MRAEVPRSIAGKSDRCPEVRGGAATQSSQELAGLVKRDTLVVGFQKCGAKAQRESLAWRSDGHRSWVNPLQESAITNACLQSDFSFLS